MLTMEADRAGAGAVKQLTLYDARRGMAGGCELVRRYGVAHMAKIGAKGGTALVKARGVAYMRTIGAKGAQTRWKKRENDPNTVKYWDGTIRRVIPYKPTKSRAKKPQYVHILLFPEGVEI